MIKAILFDFDGVLTTAKTGSETIIEYLAKYYHIEVPVLEKAYYQFNDRLLKGTCTHEDIWDELCNKVGVKMDYEVLEEAFYHTRLDEKMIHLVEELHKKYKIGMVTDNKADRMGVIIGGYQLDQLFDQFSISANYGSGKKHSLIFKKTMEALHVQPEECIFIDNTAQNLIVPANMGMKTILFDDEVRDMKKLTDLCKEGCDCREEDSYDSSWKER